MPRRRGLLALAIVSIVALLGGCVGLPARPSTDQAATSQAPVDPEWSQYQPATDHDLQLIGKDADVLKGEVYSFYALAYEFVTSGDGNDCAINAYIGSSPDHADARQGVHVMLVDTEPECPRLDQIAPDDIVHVAGRVDGGVDHEDSLGESLKVPVLSIQRIERVV